MEPRTKAYPAKIFPYLLLVTLTLLLSGQAQKAPRKVNGIVGGTALLSVMVPHDLLAVEVRWTFGSAGPTKALLGDSKKREFVPFNLSFTNYSQLIQRLDMYNETTLKIKNLTKGDGGVYKAHVQFINGNINEEEFQLNVYDPVPIPHIENILLVDTSDGCNVTLTCTANDLNISWAIQDPLGNIEMQNNSDGNMLNLSIHNQTAANYKYFCVAKNPVEDKNASIGVVCPMRSHLRHRAILYTCILITVFLAVIVVLYFYFWRRRKKKKLERNHEACTKVELQETRSGDILYADIVLDNAEGIDQCPGSKAERPIVLRTQTSKPTIYNEICIP